MSRLDEKAGFVLQRLDEVPVILVWEFHTGVTTAANQVVVRLFTGDLIDQASVGRGRIGDQAQIAQQLERSVNGGPVNGRRLLLHQRIDLFRPGMFADLTDGIQHHLSLRCHPVPLVV